MTNVHKTIMSLVRYQVHDNSLPPRQERKMSYTVMSFVKQRCELELGSTDLLFKYN